MKNNMMMDAFVIDSTSMNPYENLAFEEYLLNFCRTYQKPILYLWQNENTVVVGKNQNIYTECNMNVLRERRVFLARRLTGGGAVYHDVGNLNYTIITPKELYNIEKNTEIVVKALRRCGLDACKNGRNDICTPKGKISGNAYYSDDCVGLQHGTVLYKADVVTMEAVLSVSEGKLSRKGIKSVRSRISDVVTQVDNVTISDIKESILRTFLNSYEIEDYDNHIIVEKEELETLINKYSSREWIKGKINEYSFSKKTNLPWGEVEICVLAVGETVSEIELYSDCIDVTFVENVRSQLRECVKRQTNNYFPMVDIKEKVFSERKDWIISFNDFLREVLAEIGID